MPEPTSVVLIDDHKIFREGLRALLGAESWIRLVGEASNGTTGLELITEARPDVAVVDMAMPERDGFAVLIDVRSRKLASKVILLTSDNRPDQARRAVDAGVDGYVLKEDAYGELIEAVRAVVEGRQFLSPSISMLLVKRQSQTIRQVRQLSPRERDVLSCVSEGLQNKEIADVLGVSISTVKTHRQNLMEKLDLHSASELTRYAIEHGIVK